MTVEEIKMKCDICKSNEANVVYRQNINGDKQTFHLCSHCFGQIRKSKGIDFGSDLLNSDFNQAFANMPFGLMSRLGNMAHAFDDNFFDGIFSFLGGSGPMSFDLSPFMRSRSITGFRPVNTDKDEESTNNGGELNLRDRDSEYLSEDTPIQNGEINELDEEAKLIERLARISYDKEKGFTLELEENDSKANEDKRSELKLLTADSLNKLIQNLDKHKAIELVQAQKNLAVKNEEYERAAELRDLINKMLDDETEANN